MTILSFAVFNPKEWGTVSDWVTIIVYTITGYLIYRTLRSQLSIQQIESNRAAREIRPVFSLLTITSGNLYTIKLVCEHNIAFDVHTSYNIDASMDNKENLIFQGKSHYTFIKPGAPSWDSSGNVGEYMPNGFLQVRFKDEDGRQYQQRLSFSEDHSVENDLPTLINR
ncbi:hypothetical protein [Pedobacter sp. UYP1]|uniref:hypothetical protein n=1 Tax=Pedobacter sp. UYP1 TaxID=1756396 RepID=UPI003398F4E2